MAEPPIYHVVLTGGPCGGKSTVLAAVSERMENLGWRVLRVPEAATLLLGGGLRPLEMSAAQKVEFQEQIARVTLALESAFAAFARSAGRPCLVLHDRGVIDGAAYLEPGEWAGLLRACGWSQAALRDHRYDAVIHLVTAAEGAEGFYGTATNAVRYETVEQARLVDQRTREAWVGHPYLRVIDNSTGFERKIDRALAAICNLMGLPEPREFQKRFLVRRAPPGEAWPVRSEEVEIEQVYLAGAGEGEARVRRRSQDEVVSFSYTVKRPRPGGGRFRVQRPIDEREHAELVGQADPARRAIRKRRRAFLWRHRYFELDMFTQPCPGLQILEVELDDPAEAVELPPFVEVVREVTDDPAYLNHTLALSSFRAAPSSFRAPPYAFVPGLTPHPFSDPAGHSFGQPRPTSTPLDPLCWEECADYRHGIDLFNGGFYWEAHEVWEGLWQAAGRDSALGKFLQGLIKLAAAGVKVREGKARGTVGLARSAGELIGAAGVGGRFLGLEVAELLGFCRQAEESATDTPDTDPAVRVVFPFVLRPAREGAP